MNLRHFKHWINKTKQKKNCFPRNITDPWIHYSVWDVGQHSCIAAATVRTQNCRRKIQQNQEYVRYKMDDPGAAPYPWCSPLENALLWTKVKVVLDNQFVPIHRWAVGRWWAFTICTTDEPASSCVMQHFSACLRRKKAVLLFKSCLLLQMKDA